MSTTHASSFTVRDLHVTINHNHPPGPNVNNDDTNMTTEPDISSLPSSDHSRDNWPNFHNFNDRIYMLHGYTPLSLDPFALQRPRSPPPVSPTSSSPTSSPLSSASRELTSSTPGSTYMPSPVLTDMNNMPVLEPDATNYNGNGTSEEPLVTHQEQLVQSQETLSRGSAGEFGPFLPQTIYKPHCPSDPNRDVEEVTFEAPIYFKTEHPNQEGILLKNALHSRTQNLVDPNQLVFEGRGASVTIRLEWPGYPGWWGQLPTKDFRSPSQPITLSKLAQNIAKCIQRFMDCRKGHSMEEGSDPFWKIGNGVKDIRLEDLVLVSLLHVSLGSWQPRLKLVCPCPDPRHRQELESHGQSMSISPMPPMGFPSISESPNILALTEDLGLDRELS